MRMFDRISDDMLDTIAVRGTPETCATEIIRRFGDVADRVCCYFPGYDPPVDQIRALAEALDRADAGSGKRAARR
ncbi:hypothetical protein [Nocardia cyriacigeorgica]|nr:hypothetical protein [Nocardia cyriacigeorgica]